MSIINQMLKDLEQRRAQSFDDKGGILDDLAAGGLQSGRNRGVKLILLLLIAIVALLAWLLWDRFMQTSEPVINVAKQETTSEPQATVSKPLVNKSLVEMTEMAPVDQAERTDMEIEQVVVIGETIAGSAKAETPEEIVPDSDKTQESIKDSQLPAGGIPARIERIVPEQFVATGKRTVMRVYGEGFIPPLEVRLEWTDGRDFRVLDGWQVELISESEMRLHFNPGTQSDEWAVRVERHDGARSERYAFKVHALEEKIQQDDSAVTVKLEQPEQQSSSSKTRRKLAPDEQAANLFAEVSGLLKNGQSSEAEKLLHRVISLNSGHSRARELLASLLFQNQKYPQATDVLEAGIVRDPGHIPFRLLLARVHMEQGRDTDAILVLESQKPLARNYSDYYALLAALYQRTGRHADAATVYRGLVEVFPGRAVWWMGLGISLQSLNKSVEALAAYQRASRAQGLQPELKDFVQQRIRLLGG